MANVLDGPRLVATVPESLRLIRPSDEARCVATECRDLIDFAARLHRDRLDVDLLQLQAYVLPVRRAVWWGVLCTWHGAEGKLPVAEDAQLGLAARWVAEPSEIRRRHAEEAARNVTLNTGAAYCLHAAAVAGAMVESENRFRPGDPRRAARLIADSVFFAFARRLEIDRGVRYDRFYGLGQWCAEAEILLPLSGKERA